MWSTSMICFISYSVLLAKRLVMLPRRNLPRFGYLINFLISDPIEISDSEDVYYSASLLLFAKSDESPSIPSMYESYIRACFTFFECSPLTSATPVTNEPAESLLV